MSAFYFLTDFKSQFYFLVVTGQEKLKQNKIVKYFC